MHPILKIVRQNQVIAALVLILIGWFLLLIHEVIIALFIAFIIMAALHPLVDLITKQKVPRGVAVLITIILVFSILILLVLPLIPFFSNQVTRLFVSLPMFINNAAGILGFPINTQQINELITSEIATLSRNAFQVTTQIFGGFFTVLTTLVISFYMLLDRERIIKEIKELFPEKYQKKAEETIAQTEDKLGAWLRGQLTLSLFVGGITYVALTAIGLEFALPLAVLAGLLEIIPTIGPIIAAIPAIIVALSMSGFMAISVAITYILIQILENNILVPRIMQKAVGLNPIVVIVGVIAGAKLLGVIGALLSIPFIALMIVLYNSLRNNVKHED